MGINKRCTQFISSCTQFISSCNQFISRCTQFISSCNQFISSYNQFIINNLLNIIKDRFILQPQYTGSWSGWFHHTHLEDKLTRSRLATPPIQLTEQEGLFFHSPSLQCSRYNLILTMIKQILL